MMDYRPCGACGELVTPLGCQHWRPGSVSYVRVRGSSVANLTPEQLEAKRARDRELRKNQRAAAKERVREFQQVMGVTG